MLKTKEKCAITGLPAKYRDPVSGLPYANLEAFKVIREQHTPKAESNADKSSSEPAKNIAPGGHANPAVSTSLPANFLPTSSEAIADGSIVTAEQLAKLGMLLQMYWPDSMQPDMSVYR